MGENIWNRGDWRGWGGNGKEEGVDSSHQDAKRPHLCYLGFLSIQSSALEQTIQATSDNDKKTQKTEGANKKDHEHLENIMD